MFMNAKDYVSNIRNLLLNLTDNEHNTAFFRDIEDNNVEEFETNMGMMSEYLAENYDSSDELYMTIDAKASMVDVVITTYER